MQKSKSKRSAMDIILKEDEKGNYWSWWKKEDRGIESRTHIYFRGFIKERVRIPSESKQRDELVRSDQCDGQSKNLYNIGSETGRVYSYEETEDPNINDTQSKRWRGG